MLWREAAAPFASPEGCCCHSEQLKMAHQDLATGCLATRFLCADSTTHMHTLTPTHMCLHACSRGTLTHTGCSHIPGRLIPGPPPTQGPFLTFRQSPCPISRSCSPLPCASHSPLGSHDTYLRLSGGATLDSYHGGMRGLMNGGIQRGKQKLAGVRGSLWATGFHIISSAEIQIPGW